MKKNVSLILLILSAMLVTCTRQTKYFKNIEVRGRLLNYYTKAPIEGVTITLKSNDAHTASSYGYAPVKLATSVTNSDGTFQLNSKAAKKDQYYLQIEGDDHVYSNLTDTAFNAAAGTRLDIGTLYSGEHVFWYKMRLRSTSGNCAWVN